MQGKGKGKGKKQRKGPGKPKAKGKAKAKESKTKLTKSTGVKDGEEYEDQVEDEEEEPQEEEPKEEAKETVVPKAKARGKARATKDGHAKQNGAGGSKKRPVEAEKVEGEGGENTDPSQEKILQGRDFNICKEGGAYQYYR